MLSPSLLFFPSLPFPSSIFPCFSFFVFIFCSFSSPSFSLYFRSIPLLSLFFFLFLLSISFALFYVFHPKFLFLFFLSIVVLPPFFFLSCVSPFGIYKGKRGGGGEPPYPVKLWHRGSESYLTPVQSWGQGKMDGATFMQSP